MDAKHPDTSRTAAATAARRQHGLHSKHLLGPDEDGEELESLKQRLMDAMAPADEVEAEIASNTVGNQWVIRRLHRLQVGVLEVYGEGLASRPKTTPNIQGGRAALHDDMNGKTLQRLVSNGIRLANQTLRNVKELRLRQDQRRPAPASWCAGCCG
jgi:hypothetical protein